MVDALDGAVLHRLRQRSRRPTSAGYLALDVSGSMSGGVVAGVPGLTPRLASAAMALVTAATEREHAIVGFSAAPGGYGGQWGGGDPGLRQSTSRPASGWTTWSTRARADGRHRLRAADEVGAQAQGPC